MNIGFSNLVWLFTLAVTLHMIEEVIWLPAWSQSAGKWHEPVDRRPFAFATAVLLIFLYLVTIMASVAQPETLSIYLLCSLALVMIINLAIPHLGATIAQRRYAPGLSTSLFFVFPLSCAVLFQAFASDFISMPRYLLAAVGMLLGAAVIWPKLFRIGRRLPS